MKEHQKYKIIPYILIFPTFILFTVFFILPLLFSVYLSLNDWNGFSSNIKFCSINNYIRLIYDPMFWNAFKNSINYAIATVPVAISLSLLLSILISEKIFGFSFLRGAYFIPHIVSMVAVAVVWTWIFNSKSYGLLNWILGYIGIKPVQWLTNPSFALISLIIMGVWKSLGYNIVILLAGLKSIPNSIYEAASIDGTNSWSKFRYITFPLLMPTLFFITVTSTIQAFFKVFDQVNVMTQGGPVDSTEVLVTYLYKMGFKQYEVGYASAISFVLFIIIILITLLQKLFIEKRIDY